MSYSVFITKSAHGSLSRIAAPFQNRIIAAIRNLAGAPRPPGARKLRGRDAWRIRVGDYRVIYEIRDDLLRVVVVVIGHRREVYR